MRPAYRWPPPSPMPLRSESPRPQDTAAAQGVRASQQVPSRYAAPGLYYQQSQGRAQPQAPVPSQPYAPQAAAMANKSMYYAPYTEQHSPDFADRSSASAFSSRETGNPFPSYPHSPAMRSYHADVQGPLTGPELTAPAPGSTAWGSHTDSAYDTRRPSRDGDREGTPPGLFSSRRRMRGLSDKVLVTGRQ
ncbi:hypothetical protein BV25DRAFT_1160016 [Artomyces pyxidatus]|uniref:Uncharacterized protein n=1 Tax=Artomyces pyxidatus TaxID=48021 RepID=A0ACB8SSP4_9AGAM|nr:hypothetical protein BV25DRAFT_1160016 [Artomyces pyxidatus]